jgi:hypothetical protein
MLRHAFALISLLALAACAAAGPPKPLLSPQGEGNYGYSEQPLDGSRYRVVYVGPTRNAFGYERSDSPAERQAADLAFDLALWRAAQIAQARGFQGFVLQDTKMDIRTRNEPGYYDRPYGGFGVGGSRYGSGVGLGIGVPLGGTQAYSSLHAKATLTVELANGGTAKYYDAAAVMTQARRNYPGAEGAPAT